MLTYAILRLLYCLYFGGALIAMCHGSSYFLSKNTSFKDRAIYMTKCWFAAISWPLMLLSKAGRQYLSQFLTKI